MSNPCTDTLWLPAMKAAASIWIILFNSKTCPAWMYLIPFWIPLDFEA